MELILFLKAMVMGFAVAAPIGPVGVLCISRTLRYGRWRGVMTGLGVALADTILSTVAVLGLSAVAAWVDREQLWLRLGGGAFLIVIGLRMFWRTPAVQHREVGAQDFWHISLTAFLITFTNPVTLLGFAGLMAALSIPAAIDSAGTATVVLLGVFCGSMGWWVALSLGTGLLRGWLTDDHIRAVNKWLGLLLAVLGLGVMASALIERW